MKLKLFFAFLALTLFLQADDEAKFLVIDNATYNKIENLGILNGGIVKKSIVSSTRLSKEDLKLYYPELSLYQGEVCYAVNKVVTTQNKNTQSTFVSKLQAKEEVLEEIKRIKLLQMLTETEQSKIATSQINEKIIKALGIICNNHLVIRGERYAPKHLIGTLKIDSLSYEDGIVYIEGN